MADEESNESPLSKRKARKSKATQRAEAADKLMSQDDRHRVFKPRGRLTPVSKEQRDKNIEALAGAPGAFTTEPATHTIRGSLGLGSTGNIKNSRKKK